MKSLKQTLLFFSMLISTAAPVKAEVTPSSQSAYDFTFTALDGSDMPLSAYKGKVLLIVNTASKCGLTPQYAKLEALYQKYKDKGLVIIGVPSNDFGQQEPGTAAEIKSFCALNYGVTFPMTSKYAVTGDNAHPFYKWAEKALGNSTNPKWNFHKYLIDKKGNVVDYFGSMTAPDSSSITSKIDTLLAH